MRVPFLDFLKNNRVYLDGAFGSELIARGLSADNPALLNITNPIEVKSIHDGYVAAGSDVVFANTFGANLLKIDGFGFSLDQIVSAAVSVARKSAGQNKYVAYDCGPLGELLKPFGRLSFEQAYLLFAAQAEAAKNTDIDFVVIETMTDLLELKAAVLAFQDILRLPVACSMSFDAHGRTFTGVGIAPFALTMQGLGVDLIGLNCGMGPDLMLKNTEELIRNSHTPIFVKPNAGLPQYQNGKTLYSMDSSSFADSMAKIAEMGVSVLGGCCGTNPQYIAQTIQKTQNLPTKRFENFVDAVCSSTAVVPLKPTIIVGEKINPTGRPLLKQALTTENWDYISTLALEQTDNGAHILDVNAGMSGIDETYALTQSVLAVQAVVNAPIQIDSSRFQAVEAALRVLNGVPVINSVNGEPKSMENILPLAKRFGAYVVALCLDENGVPDTVDGRISVAKKILDEAKKYGIEKERILFDALTLAISVDGKNALVTLETMRRLRDELKVKTIIGLSNVSFGLPARHIINAEFFRCLLGENVTACIIDPVLKPSYDELAQNALNGQDPNCEKFVEAYADCKQQANADGESLFEIVRRGKKSEAAEAVARFVNEKNFLEVVERDIIGALNVLGEDYEKGIVYLPQLIVGAESAKTALNEISVRYMAEGAPNRATIVMATVKGDVHDIGKNIVKTVLGNYGYRIVDLGKDVGAEAVLDAIEKFEAKAVGLSALMTTTLDSMAHITNEVKKRFPAVLVMVGGAVVTAAFAEQIGADLYCRDAQDCVKKLDGIMPAAKSS